jgi:GalNAc-alpha-(1->4)-GalNAc-alpha-(1->3)-diNAcBac-PP-undecaprenol alpha-1,4-N-acetyl-D-galactosaminyltransferase
MDRGGASRVLSILANHFSTAGWNVELIFFRLRNRYDISNSVKLIQLCDSDDKISPFRLIFRLRRYLKTTESDTIISFLMPVNFLTILSSIGLNKRVIISERNDPLKSGRRVWKKIADILYRKADTVVFQSKRVKSHFPAKIQNKSVVILNPIKVAVSACGNNSKKIVSVGKLYPQKNHKLLINAFCEIHKKYLDYSLHIYGEGPLRTELERQIENLGIGNAVFLHGNHADVHKRINDAEIFVLSSDYEGLSNALLEAMMMGIPCISTDCAGSDEIITDEVNGILVPTGNKKKLVEAMEKLICNKKLAIAIAQKSKEDSSSYGIKNVVNMWEKIIEGHKLNSKHASRIKTEEV